MGIANTREKLRQDIDLLRDALEIAESATPQVTHDPKWDRVPDGTIIKVTAKEPISKQSAMQALDAWLLEFKGKYIWSDVVSKEAQSFIIKFMGPPGTAKQRVTRALSSLRGEDGNWTKFAAKLPVEAGTGDDGGDVRNVHLSVGPDKSSKQVSTEISGKRLRDILAQALPGKRCFFSRNDGKISSGWTSPAKVVPNPDKSVTIEWNNASPLAGQIDKQDVVKRFRDGGKEAVREEWVI